MRLDEASFSEAIRIRALFRAFVGKALLGPFMWAALFGTFIWDAPFRTFIWQIHFRTVIRQARFGTNLIVALVAEAFAKQTFIVKAFVAEALTVQTSVVWAFVVADADFVGDVYFVVNLVVNLVLGVFVACDFVAEVFVIELFVVRAFLRAFLVAPTHACGQHLKTSRAGGCQSERQYAPHDSTARRAVSTDTASQGSRDRSGQQR
jgi:hypothetical protein